MGTDKEGTERYLENSCSWMWALWWSWAFSQRVEPTCFMFLWRRSWICRPLPLAFIAITRQTGHINEHNRISYGKKNPKCSNLIWEEPLQKQKKCFSSVIFLQKGYGETVCKIKKSSYHVQSDDLLLDQRYQLPLNKKKPRSTCIPIQGWPPSLFHNMFG